MSRIAVYGATGYTGRLVARELRDRGIAGILCGRNAGKLRALADDLGVDWPVRAAAIDDTPALVKALGGADAVVNCAGPFTFYGAPVIEAALAAGVHYVDTTGEQQYIRRVYEHLDGPARRAGRAVIPAVGFDYLPGDLVASVAAGDAGEIEELTIAYAVSGFGMSRGTMRSGLEMLGDEWLEYRDGALQRARRAPLRDRFDFGGDLGEQPVVGYAGGEIVTVPRHVTTKGIRYRWTASTFAPHPAVSSAVGPAMGVLGALLRTPLRDLADLGIDRLPEGPAEDDRAGSRWTIVAEARDASGEITGRAVVSGPDMYGITAVIAVRAAELLAADGFTGKGALAPAEAFDAEEFLRSLAPHGVELRVDEPARHAAKA